MIQIEFIRTDKYVYISEQGQGARNLEHSGTQNTELMQNHVR